MWRSVVLISRGLCDLSLSVLMTAFLMPPRAQDLPGALDAAQVTEGLGLSSIKTRQWSIFKTSALRGEGIWEGMDWLAAALRKR